MAIDRGVRDYGIAEVVCCIAEIGGLLELLRGEGKDDPNFQTGHFDTEPGLNVKSPREFSATLSIASKCSAPPIKSSGPLPSSCLCRA